MLTAEERDAFTLSWPKECGCGAQYDAPAWEKLKYVGIQKSSDTEVPELEMRLCDHCTSTMAIPCSIEIIAVKQHKA